MSIEYLGLSSINGPLIALEGVQDAFFDEIVEFVVDGNERKIGRIVEIYEDKAVIQVFEGSENMSLKNTHTKLTGHPMEIALSPDMLGRTFNGIGQPIDDLGPIVSTLKRDVNGLPLNPVRREYPRNYIHTGISAIDGLTTLIRGQKLPIFSGNGLPHDQLAAQIVKQASLGENSDEQFAIVFAAMGVKHDVADFFRNTFEESGVADHVAMFLNLANDPVVERLITPKVALTVAEYLAFEQNMHILVILTDMTSFAEAMREVSSSKGEIPSRKGYPGYLYSELATIYERAGIVQGVNGSVTQLPILTMPNDDITHPIPDLTGYITEGQIVLDRPLHGHDGRAPDYDDWKLNGDIIVYYPVLDIALELSSMGIRVDAESLAVQLKKSRCEERARLPFQKSVLDGTLPLTIGGGIGQSRLCMFFLRKAHIGEVQCSIWPKESVEVTDAVGIQLL